MSRLSSRSLAPVAMPIPPLYGVPQSQQPPLSSLPAAAAVVVPRFPAAQSPQLQSSAQASPHLWDLHYQIREMENRMYRIPFVKGFFGYIGWSPLGLLLLLTIVSFFIIWLNGWMISMIVNILVGVLPASYFAMVAISEFQTAEKPTTLITLQLICWMRYFILYSLLSILGVTMALPNDGALVIGFRVLIIVILFSIAFFTSRAEENAYKWKWEQDFMKRAPKWIRSKTLSYAKAAKSSKSTKNRASSDDEHEHQYDHQYEHDHTMTSQQQQLAMIRNRNL